MRTLNGMLSIFGLMTCVFALYVSAYDLPFALIMGVLGLLLVLT